MCFSSIYDLSRNLKYILIIAKNNREYFGVEFGEKRTPLLIRGNRFYLGRDWSDPQTFLRDLIDRIHGFMYEN